MALTVQFRMSPDYTQQQLMRDLIELVRQLETIQTQLQAQINALDARLIAGGL